MISGLLKQDKDGIFPIIFRQKGAEKTDPCPFCNKPHIHGEPNGHRIVHCEGEERIQIISGVVCSSKNGYWLQDYDWKTENKEK